MKIKTLAIPIRRLDFGDSSQILSLFTREHGVVEGIAKGAYREKNAFQGPFDLLGLDEVVFVSRAPGAGLAVITEATHLEGFCAARAHWDRYTAALFLLEFLRAVAMPAEPAPGLFDLAAGALEGIAAARAPDRLADLLAAFELRAFRILGLSGEIGQCGDCGRPWREVSRPVFFCPEFAGILCPGCRKRRPGRTGKLVPGEVVQLINQLGRAPGGNGAHPALLASGPAASRGPEEAPSPVPPPTDPSLRADLRSLLAQLRVFLLERRFQVLEYTAHYF